MDDVRFFQARCPSYHSTNDVWSSSTHFHDGTSQGFVTTENMTFKGLGNASK